MASYRVRGDQLSLLFRRIARQIDDGAKEAEAEAMKEALKVARSLSSGPLTTRKLAQMGHPYRIGGSPPFDPAIINRQTGKFFAKWRIVGPRRTATGLSSRLVNEAPYAKFLARGTPRMISRPFPERIRQQVAAKRQQLWRAMLRQRVEQAARSMG
jgi:hypothetical protein